MGGVAVDLLYFQPVGSLAPGAASSWLGLAVFGLISTAIMFVVSRHRKAIEQKHAAEQRLQMGLEAANAATWDADLKSGQIYWSATHFKLLAYQQGEVQPSLDAWKARGSPRGRKPGATSVE